MTKSSSDRDPAKPEWVPASAPPEVDATLRDGDVNGNVPEWQIDLLARRGVRTREEADRFLRPTVTDLHAPSLLPGITEAAARIASAHAAGKAVAIVGDYDADGISATALLFAVLQFCGVEAHCILPHRLEEGYGFQPIHVDRAIELGCSLIVTVDCGTTSFQGHARAGEANIDLIITDHHQPDEPLAEGIIEVNPHREGGRYPFLDLSGAGLALKLAQAVADALDREVPIEALLRVACLGTIADLVPLLGENRVIAALGLDAMKDLRSVGLRALMEMARIRPPVAASDVGFRIGPRLNAAGRMGEAEPALRLLLTRDAGEGRSLAAKLERANSERRSTEAVAVDGARAQFLDCDPLPRVLVASSPDWHRGVLGIAASRIAREFHRPTLLLQELDGGVATGSGRSIAGVHLYDLIAPSRDTCERFGGHQQAVGLTVQTERIDRLREELEGRAISWDENVLVRTLVYELEFAPEEVTRALIDQLHRLEPFGMGNRRPRARIGAMRVLGKPRTFGKGHMKATIADTPEPLRLLGWNWADRIEELSGTFEAIGTLSIDRYDDTAQIDLEDVTRVGP